MRAAKIVFSSIICILALCVNAFAQTSTMYGERGPSIGKEFGDESGEYSDALRSGDEYVNLFTGTSKYKLDLMGIKTRSGIGYDLALRYTSAQVDKKMFQCYGTYLTNWTGLGWFLGISEVLADTKGTATKDDDKYYYRHEDGSISEIMRIGTDENSYTYQIKDRPYWKIEVSGSWSWKVTRTSGDVFVYAGVPQPNRCEIPEEWSAYYTRSSPTQACAYPVIDKDIIIFKWPLLVIHDRHSDDRLWFTYEQVEGKTLKLSFDGEEYINLKYRASSYIKEIKNTQGEKIVFDRGTKDSDELLPVDEPIIESKNFCTAEIRIGVWEYRNMDLSEREYLKSIRYLDPEGVEVKKVNFEYSDENGQSPHLETGKSSFKTRLLTGVFSDYLNEKSINRSFEYNRGSFTGMLEKVSDPTMGMSIHFIYGMQTLAGGSGSSIDKIASPVVKSIVLSGGVPGISDVTRLFTYSTSTGDQYFDPDLRIPHWRKVTTTTPGFGSVVSMFNIDSEQEHLFGRPSRIEKISENGDIVTSADYEYASKAFGTGEDVWYAATGTKITGQRDGVVFVSGTPECGWNQTNGLHSIRYETNSDGVSRVEKTVFAYEEYDDMVEEKMLSQVASRIVYRCANFNPSTCDLSSAAAVQASYTTWAVANNGKWERSAKYVWNVPMNAQGIPTATFQEFDESAPSANGWQMAEGYQQYDTWGNVLETVNGVGTDSTAIYRNDFNLLSAVVRNCQYDNCAVYTGDYQSGGEDWLDEKNGWGLSDGDLPTGAISEVQGLASGISILYSSTALRVKNAKAATKRIVIPSKNTTFTFSAWVYPLNNYAIRFAASTTIDGTAYPSLHSDNVYDAAGGLEANKWQLVEFDVAVNPAIPNQDGLDGGSDDHFYIWLGNHSGDDPVDMYVMDIRFSPKSAYVSSNYYDSKWHLPVVSVDANNQPLRRLEYDEHARPYKEYKAQLADGNKLGEWVIVSKKSYHNMGDNTRIVEPNGGERLTPGKEQSIVWSGPATVGTNGVNLYFYDGSTWAQISGASGIKGQNVFSWTIPQNVSTGCRVKVQSVDDSQIQDVSDEDFAIVNYLATTTPAEGSVVSLTQKWQPSHPDYVIHWSTSGGSDANVRIDYFDGKSWIPVVENTPNTGSYSWAANGIGAAVPNVGHSRFRISDAVSGMNSRESAFFVLRSNYGYVRRLHRGSL